MNDLTPISEIPAGTLTKYDAACRALAEAKAVDEVLEILNVSEAMRAYARQAKDKQLENDAVSIRLRAERRLGEMMRQQKETVGLNVGAMGAGINQYTTKELRGTGNPTPLDDRPTLAEAGIDKNLAKRARRAAEKSPEEFEADVEEQQERIIARPPDKTTRKARQPGSAQERMIQIYSDGRWHTVSDVADKMDETIGNVQALIDTALSNGRPRARAKWEQKKGSYRLLFPTEKMISVGVLVEELTPIIRELREQGARRMETVSTSTIAIAAANLDKLLKEWAK